MKFLLLIFKNVRRNLLRSLLTALGTMVLVMVVTPVWSVLQFLDMVTAEQSKNLKAIVTERWQVPSLMPISYADSLSQGAARKPGDVRPLDSMTWEFYVGTMDPEKLTLDAMLVVLAVEPAKIATMLDELDSLLPADMARLKEAIHRLEVTRNGIILGKDRLAALKKSVGQKFSITGINYKDINLDFEIVGLFPDGRYDNSAMINREYLSASLDKYKADHNNTPHPMADKTLNLVWLKLPDRETFARVAEQIAASPNYPSPAVKCETASSGISTFLDAYRDLIWGMRWILSPAVIVTLSLVVANAVSISVRERRTELAVLKVLGFRPWQIMALVLGESLLIGTMAGLLSAMLTYGFVNYVRGGLKFPIGFFPAFFISASALWWGVAIGAGAALAGSIVPAITARNVKVAEVFAKVG